MRGIWLTGGGEILRARWDMLGRRCAGRADGQSADCGWAGGVGAGSGGGGCTGDAGGSAGRFPDPRFSFPVGRAAGGVEAALPDAGRGASRCAGTHRQRGDDPAWNGRDGSSVSGAVFCRGTVWTGAAAGCEEVLHRAAGRHWPWRIFKAERWHARTFSALRLRRHGGGRTPPAGRGSACGSSAAADGDVDGLHALVGVGAKRTRGSAMR